MHSSRVAVAVLLAVCTPATGFTMGSVARHAVAPRASARMDEESKKRAEDALERAQQRAKAYAKEKRAKRAFSAASYAEREIAPRHRHMRSAITLLQEQFDEVKKIWPPPAGQGHQRRLLVNF